MVKGIIFSVLALGILSPLNAEPVHNIFENPIFENPVHDPWIPKKPVWSFGADLADAYHSYDVTNYKLNIAFDPILGTLSGENTVTFKATQDYLGSLILDAVDMEILDVRLSDDSSLLFQYDREKISITLPYAFQAGVTGQVRVRFQSRRPQMLYTAGPDASHPGRGITAYTFTQPDGSRHWYPCHDIPSDKASAQMTFTVPQGSAVASNGAEYPVRYLPAQRVSFSFDTQVNIATYLVSVVLGRMNSEQIGQWRQAPLLISGPSHLMPALRAETARTAQMMQAFENFTQTPYPFQKYRQTVAEGFNASMEHQSATTMGGRRIVGDRSGESVVAHELAHQWFGDLVTCGVWGDMWLNEGFASYLPLVFSNFVGESHDVLTSLLSLRDGYFNSTDLNNARAISTPEEWPTYNIFDQHSYAKGALVIHLMRKLANSMAPDVNGVEAFSRALGLYLHQHSYGNVRYFDLRDALERTTGQSWAKFFDEWVLSTGHPEVTSSWSWNNSVLSLSIRQDQALRTERPWGKFSFPLSIRIVAEDGTSSRHAVSVTDMEQTFTIQSQKQVTAVVLDANLVVPGKFKVVQPAEAWLAAWNTAKGVSEQAVILTSLFQNFDDATLAPIVGTILETSPSPTLTAVLARLMTGRPGLMTEAKQLVLYTSSLSLPMSLKAAASGLESSLIVNAKPEDRPMFAATLRQWKIARRVEEREDFMVAMLATDVVATHTFARNELNNSRWTDRDRISLVKALATETTSVSKPVILSLLKTNRASNISGILLYTLIKRKYDDPDALALLRVGALTHRISTARVRYVQLLGFQSAQKEEACTALEDIAAHTSQTGTKMDQETLPAAIVEAQRGLGCL